jgi:predicted ArsR family transcriptional regulator
MEKPLSTKSRILALLKRSPASTVDTIAGALQLAPMTVRQHLTVLERDGLLACREDRGTTGRPRYVYSLTEAGEETFPRRYDELAREVLTEAARLTADEIAGLSAEEKTRLLFDKLADRRYEPYRADAERRDLPGRVALAAEILCKDGGIAEWTQTPDGGFELRDYNCAYRRVAQADSAVCDWHTRFVQNLVGSPVNFEAAGGHCAACRWTVIEESRGESANGWKQPD